MLEVLTTPSIDKGVLYNKLVGLVKAKKQKNEVHTALSVLSQLQDTDITHNILNHFSYSFLTVLTNEQEEQLSFKTDIKTTIVRHNNHNVVVIFSATLKTLRTTVLDILSDKHLHELGHELRQYFTKEGMQFLWDGYRTVKDGKVYTLIEDKRK